MTRLSAGVERLFLSVLTKRPRHLRVCATQCAVASSLTASDHSAPTMPKSFDERLCECVPILISLHSTVTLLSYRRLERAIQSRQLPSSGADASSVEGQTIRYSPLRVSTGCSIRTAFIRATKIAHHPPYRTVPQKPNLKQKKIPNYFSWRQRLPNLPVDLFMEVM